MKHSLPAPPKMLRAPKILSLASAALVSFGSPAHAAAPPQNETRHLIDGLTGLSSFDTGLSPVYGGSDFPPVAGQFEFRSALLNQSLPHRRDPGLLRLVELGPAALPDLLKHLDDKRPTKLVVKHEFSIGAMWYGHEVPFRPGNQAETDAVKKAGFPDDDSMSSLENGIAEHTITVGDVCFVIVGMITNRSYNALRYQPTACEVINSPTACPQIAAAVRAIWSKGAGPDPLFQHLKADFDAGFGEDKTRQASFPCEYLALGAATRLLYYFPDRSADFVHARLKQLIDRHRKDDAPLLARFLKATAWSPDPGIRKSIRDFLLRTDSPEMIENGIAAFADPGDPQNHEDLLRLADKMKTDAERKDGSADAARAALLTNLKTFPEKKTETVRGFLDGAGPSSCRACCLACYRIKSPPAAELAPLLAMKKSGIGRYLIQGPGVLDKPGPNDCLEYRICDNAYEIISRALGDEKCLCTGTRDVMDRRIAALRKRLDGPPETWPFSNAEIAARQKDQNKIRLAMEARRARIAKQADDQPEQVWFLTAINPESATAEIEKNVAALLTPKKWEKPYESAAEVMANRFKKNEPLHRDSLVPDQQKKVAAAMSERLLQRLKSAPRNKIDPELINMACLLARWDAGADREPLAKLVERIRKLPPQKKEDNGFRMKSPDISMLLKLLDELIYDDFPGADAAFRTLFERTGYQVLSDDMTNERHFLAILGHHPENPEVREVLRAMFLDPKSKWHLSKTTYSQADSYGEAGLLNAPVFRQALRTALEDKRIKGTLSIKADDPDYCWITWKDSESGQGIQKGEPVGAKPGGKGMPVRHCDALLEGIANSVFAKNPGPAFHIYWPLEQREKARKAWIKFLGKDRK